MVEELKRNEEEIVKDLSKRVNKREDVIKCIIKILKKENYSLEEIQELVVEFF